MHGRIDLLGPAVVSQEVEPQRGIIWGFRTYLNPEEPTFLGFLIMTSLSRCLKKVGYLGLR